MCMKCIMYIEVLRMFCIFPRFLRYPQFEKTIMATLTLQNLVKIFPGGIHALDDVSLLWPTANGSFCSVRRARARPPR